jgi:protein O-mannosyl-transferase
MPRHEKSTHFDDRNRFGPLSALNRRALAGVVLIAAVTVFAYFPSVKGEFIWDDFGLLTENTLIKSSDGLYRFWFTTEATDYWPAANSNLWLEWRLWEMNPIGYRATNLLLHIAESLLVWLLLRKLAIPGAFFAALIFALHPVNVESVAWIAQRKGLLALLFLLLSMLWYLKYFMRAPRPTFGWCPVAAKQALPTAHRPPPTSSSFSLHPSSFNLWYWLSLAAFVLAMLSKGSAAVLPALLLGVVWWIRPLKLWDMVRAAPFFIVAIVLAAANVWFQRHGSGEVFRTAGFIERLLGAGCVVWFYLYKPLLPINLASVYPQWHIAADYPLCWLPLAAAFTVTAVLWHFRATWGRPLLFAWGFFCVSLVPVMGFTDVYFMQHSLVADHYQHIAIIGIIALAAAGWGAWHRRASGGKHTPAILAAILALAALSFLTWRQSGLYHDKITLYQASLEKNPESWIAHYRLGTALSATGKLPEVVEHFQQTLRLNPNYSEAHYNLGVVLVQTGKIQEAIEHLLRALALQPDFPQANYKLGMTLVQSGRIPEAIVYFQQALTQKQDYPEAHYNLGNALIRAGRTQEAIDHLQQALLQKPNFPEAQNDLGTALVQAGKPQEAIEHCRQALRLKPDYPEAYNNLGGALVRTGQSPEAVGQFKQALRLRPDYINAWNNLALAYAQLGQTSVAVASAEKALELARSKGQSAQAKQIEDWLIAYRKSTGQ